MPPISTMDLDEKYRPCLTAQWNDMYKRLLSYKLKYGNCLVPNKYKEDKKLGNWVYRQKKIYNDNKLSDYRVEKLKSIGFVFNKEKEENEARWDDMFDRLVSYKEEHGNCLVPNKYKEDTKLGNWVSTQRENHKKKKLSNDRIEKLKSIGFVFSVLERTLLWDHMFNQLVLYKQKHGDCLVPRHCKVNTKLSSWVHDQRQSYRKNKLYDDRVEKLDSIGFVFNFRREEDNKARWNEMFDRIVSYKEEHGNCNVSTRYKEDKQLANWVARQRLNYKNNMLSYDRNEKLKSIGFVFNANQEEDNKMRWNEMFQRLLLYKEKHGNCNVPNTHEEDKQLVNWVGWQRQCYRTNKLCDDRIKKLISVGFVFSFDKTRWNEMFQRLVSYKEKYGNCKVPKNYKEDKQLADWVKRQKCNYKNDKLSYDHLSKLKGIGVLFINNEEDNKARWDEMFQRLVIYKEKHGNCKASGCYKEDKELGNWVNYQRKSYKNDKLSYDRLSKLKGIGVLFNGTNNNKKAGLVEI